MVGPPWNSHASIQVQVPRCLAPQVQKGQKFDQPMSQLGILGFPTQPMVGWLHVGGFSKESCISTRLLLEMWDMSNHVNEHVLVAFIHVPSFKQLTVRPKWPQPINPSSSVCSLIQGIVHTLALSPTVSYLASLNFKSPRVTGCYWDQVT